MAQSYSGQDLRRQHFAGQDLRGRDFSDADLREANFAGATLYKANFSGANVRGANFTTAKLDKADFSNAKIQGANFHQAKLRATKFLKVSVDDTNSLPSVDFSKAEIQGTNFTDAFLNHADFTGAQAGLTRFWSFILYGIHIFLCLISGFTATISITFLIYFFRTSSKKPSFLDSIFIGITSIVIIVTLRTFLLNFFRQFVSTSRWLGIIAIIIVFVVAFVIAKTSEEEDFSSFIMTGILLFLILIITTNAATIFAGVEDLLPKPLGNIIQNLGRKSINNPNGTNGTWISMVLTSIVGAIFGCWFSRSAINENPQFNWLWKMYLLLATTGGTTFNQADLTNAVFTSANLKGGNLQNAIITGTLWYRGKSLERARVGNNYLKLPQVRELVVRLDGKGQNFNNLNLEGINLETPNLSKASNLLERTNLSSASFVGTNLNKANLQSVNLEKANLKQTKLNGANLTKACLTGAIIEDWNIDQTTILSNVKCEFIFLNEHPDPNSGIQKRLPHPPNIFKPGDFEKIFIGERNTVQLFIRHEQNRQALTAAFEHLIKNNPDITPEDFREFRRIDDNVLVTIRVPQYTFEGVVEQEFEQVYQQVKQESPSNSRSGEFENQPLFEFILRLINTIGENMNEKREINIHGNNSRYIENNGSYVERDYINMSQDLTKAASQIQDLIEQLQKRGVTVDVAQTQVAENIATQAKNDSTMKEKLAKWGQSLGDATVSDVVKSVVKLAIRSAGIPLP
ncbi:pentapeptide repeat-containing protein [Plectonema radiosum NIES-515]|uniref:Pentapeptide repeat-containing protein n=1 Tax=Plectonema radiosum NIES-515 TaxID=2986073 RepID=A0ABT3B400_9CYAN|nr:pentapeptide repeat-containing protein [Plectonema radiosum]MCV3216097.1 pentapeptide repeat-containing protein [Plectonema radiosum NIES-515]